MNLDDFGKDIKEMHDSVEKILVSKNKDYSHSVDVHSNFKTMAQLCTLFKIDVRTPEGCIQYELVKKMHRMLKLINEGAEPEHESLWNNSMDSHAYQHLLNSYINAVRYGEEEISAQTKVVTYPDKSEVPCD